MEKFDERKKSFEKKFAHDEELKFKVASRRNKYLGQWASQKLGYDENKEKETFSKQKNLIRTKSHVSFIKTKKLNSSNGIPSFKRYKDLSIKFLDT